MLACDDIMPTGWTPAAASSTLEEWTRTFSRGQQCSCCRTRNRFCRTRSLSNATFFHFYRAMRCKRGLCCHAVSVCPSVRLSVRPSVRLSVTFVDHVETNKNIFEFFSPSGSDTILVFHPEGGADIPTGTPLTGASNARGYEKSRFSTIIFTNISLYLRNGYS